MATFHTVPLAIRIKDPALFELKLKPFCSTFDLFEDTKKAFDKSLLDVFEYIPELQPYMDRVRKNIIESCPFGEREIREPWTTIMHLDFWCNNIMITGGKDSKTMILDLQIPKLGSPVGDLIFFLLTSIDIKIISEHFDEFVKFYYNEFINNLKALKVDVAPYEFQDFLKEIDIEATRAEISHSLSHTQVIMLDKGVNTCDSSDANFTEDKLEEKIEPNEKQIEKIKWITLEAIKRNWI